MGVVVRQSIKGSIVSYFGVIIGYLNIVFITPYCLPTEIIGFNKILTDVALLLSFIAQLGLGNAIVRFYPYFKNNTGNNNIFGILIFLPLIGFAFITLLTMLFYTSIINQFKTNSTLFAENFYYALPLAFFMMFLTLFENYSSCLYRVVVPKFIRDILFRILNVLTIILFYLKVFDFQSYVIINIAIYGIGAVLNLLYISKISKLSIKVNLSAIPSKIKRNFISYIVFIFIVGIGSNIVSKVDVFMISSSINLSSTGIYSIAFYIITIIEIPSRVFLQVLNPLIAQAWKDNDMKAIEIIYKKSSLNQYYVGGILLLLIWINIDNIFAIMPNGKTFEAGKYVVLFIGIGKIFDMITGVNWFIIANSKFYYVQLFFITYITTINIFLNSILIPKYGIIGAAIASMLALASYNVLLMIFLKYKLNIWPITVNTIYLTLLFLLLYGLNFILPSLVNPIIDAIYRSIIIIGFFIIVSFHFKLSDDIHNFVQKLNIYNIIKHIKSIIDKLFK